MVSRMQELDQQVKEILENSKVDDIRYTFNITEPGAIDEYQLCLAAHGYINGQEVANAIRMSIGEIINNQYCFKSPEEIETTTKIGLKALTLWNAERRETQCP